MADPTPPSTPPSADEAATRDDTKRGLYRKYFVQRLGDVRDVILVRRNRWGDPSTDRVDPPAKHAGCRYYVLDLDHDTFAAPALRAYADACAAEFPALAADLRAMIAPSPPSAGAAREIHPATVRVLEDGRCTDTGGGGGRCLRLADHPSAHRYFDVDAGSLWQAIADLMDLEGEQRRRAEAREAVLAAIRDLYGPEDMVSTGGEHVPEQTVRAVRATLRRMREAEAARDTALAEAQALRLSLEDERRRADALAAAARPVVELAEVGSVTAEDREALGAVREELARRTT
jgi:hypothetical protein